VTTRPAGRLGATCLSSALSSSRSGQARSWCLLSMDVCAERKTPLTGSGQWDWGWPRQLSFKFSCLTKDGRGWDFSLSWSWGHRWVKEASYPSCPPPWSPVPFSSFLVRLGKALFRE
jgi:hypothetical protein